MFLLGILITMALSVVLAVALIFIDRERRELKEDRERRERIVREAIRREQGPNGNGG